MRPNGDLTSAWAKAWLAGSQSHPPHRPGHWWRVLGTWLFILFVGLPWLASKGYCQDAGYYAQQTYTGTGAQTSFTIPMPYLNNGDVYVYVNGAVQTQGTAYTLPSSTTVSFTTAPASGASVQIVRHTPITTAEATYSGGALAAHDLNTNQTQALYLAQEAQDAAHTAGLCLTTGCTFTGSVSNSTVTPTGLSTSRTLANRALDVVNAADYGVKCDNATDDTTALNTFFAALTGGKIGVINAGVCVFSNTLSMNLHGATLQGAGENATLFYYNGSSTTIDLVQINGAYSCSIGGFHIYSATKMTAGAAVHVMNSTGHCYLTGIDTGQQSEYPNYNLWNGFWVDESDGIYLTQFQDFVQNDGIDVSGQGVAHPPQYEFYATNGKIAAATIGVHVGGGWDGAYFDTIMVTTNKTNVVIDHTLQAYGNQEIIFGPRFTTDQAQTGDDYYINDNLAVRSSYCQITIMGPVTYSLTGNGIHVVSWPSCFVNVTSGWIDGNTLNGILIGDQTALVNVSSAVNIENNGQYGISSSACCATVNSTANMAGNSAGTYNFTTLYTQPLGRTFLNVTAAGTTQGTAALLPAAYNYVTSASTTYGVILPPTLGVETLVSNITGTSFLVYPPSGARIGANATNAGVVLAGATFARFLCSTAIQCYVQ